MASEELKFEHLSEVAVERFNSLQAGDYLSEVLITVADRANAEACARLVAGHVIRSAKAEDAVPATPIPVRLPASPAARTRLNEFRQVLAHATGDAANGHSVNFLAAFWLQKRTNINIFNLLNGRKLSLAAFDAIIDEVVSASNLAKTSGGTYGSEAEKTKTSRQMTEKKKTHGQPVGIKATAVMPAQKIDEVWERIATHQKKVKAGLIKETPYHEAVAMIEAGIELKP